MLRHALSLIWVLCLGPQTVAAQPAQPTNDSGAATPPAAPVPLSSVPPPANPSERPAWLKARLDAVFASPALAGAKVSVMVVDAESGKPIYARNERTGLNAASNVKLVTSAAALALLGPEFRWKTAVLGLAPAEGGRAVNPAGELQGDLYLRASGDPTLTTQDLAELASGLNAIGLRNVRGALVIDATAFDSATVGPSYDEKDDSAAFRAPSSAASLNGNTVSVIITPGPSAGAAARVVLDPPSSNLVLTGRVTTAAKGPAAPVVQTSDAGNGQTRVTVSGRIRLGSEPRIVLRRIVQPDLFLGQTFKQILQKRGITVDKPVRVAAAPKDGLLARLVDGDAALLQDLLEGLAEEGIRLDDPAQHDARLAAQADAARHGHAGLTVARVAGLHDGRSRPLGCGRHPAGQHQIGRRRVQDHAGCCTGAGSGRDDHRNGVPVQRRSRRRRAKRGRVVLLS